MALVGCAGTQKTFDSHEMGLQLVVRAAAGRVLTQKPAWVPKAYEITAAAIRLVEESTDITVGELVTFVVAKIELDKLTLEEKDLVLALIGTVRQEMENYFQAQGITTPAEVNVRVVKVLTWVNQTAEVRLAG